MNSTFHPTLCIAGKGGLAVRSLYFADRALDKAAKILVVPNLGDDGVDYWQPSLLKHSKIIGGRVELGRIEDIHAIEDLVFISLEYDKIIKTNSFSSKRLYNIHFSKLPAYKGMYTSYHPIANGESEAGATLHCIDDGIDTGDIVDQVIFPLGEEETAKTLYSKYVDAGVLLIRRYLCLLLQGNVPTSKQTARGSTYYSKASVNYACVRLDLKNTADFIRRQVNAYNHRSFQIPQVFEEKISHVEVTERRSTCPPGTILERGADAIWISTIDFDCVLKIDRFDDLMDAVLIQDTAQIRRLVGMNFTLLEETDSHGWSPLIRAAYLNLSAAVSCLLSLGANPNHANQKGTTPLMYAKDGFLSTGRKDSVELLLRAGADPYRLDMTGRTVFDYLSATDEGAFLSILKKLNLSAGAPIIPNAGSPFAFF